MNFSSAPASRCQSDVPDDADVGIPAIGEPHDVHLLGSMLSSAAGGAAGGAAFLVIAERIARYHRVDLDLVLQQALPPIRLVSLDQHARVWCFAIAVGAIGGALLGFIMRGVPRIAARLVFGAITAPLLWTFIHALVLLRFKPAL